MFFRNTATALILLLLCICAAARAAVGPTPQQMILEKLGTDRAVIFNGDDLGRTDWSNQGVLKAFQDGVVTSTSFQTPALARDAAYEMIAEHPELDVGVHLVITRDDGKDNVYGPILPPEQLPSFTDENGMFYTSKEVWQKVDKNEVYAELKAQIEHALAHGVDVTHLDCHGGWYHDYNPRTLKPVLRLAREFDLPIRWQGRSIDGQITKKGLVVPDYLVAINGRQPFKDKKKQLLDKLASLPGGITEFVFHPATGGYDQDEIDWRTTDLQLMLDPDVRAALEENNIALVGYRTLRDMQRSLRKENNQE